VTAEEIRGAINDAINKLTVFMYEHEGDEPLTRIEICVELKRKMKEILDTGELTSNIKFRVAMIELAAYAISAAADSDKKKKR
jgi:hypothetical protein